MVDGFARSCRRLAGMRSERRPTGANRPRQARGQAPRSGGARAGLRSNLPGIPGFRSSSSWVFSRYWRFGMGPLPTVSATTVHSHRPFRRLVAGEQAVRSDITAPQAVPERMAASNSCSTAVQLDSSRRSTLLTSRVYADGMKRCTPAGGRPTQSSCESPLASSDETTLPELSTIATRSASPTAGCAMTSRLDTPSRS